ncbi:MAG: hypothetical protein EF813_10220 [Methanosarcinales archaeon]|nr:MAG: hypothetical protein EF813_10220 [Methanosarcinales archaeon]
MHGEFSGVSADPDGFVLWAACGILEWHGGRNSVGLWWEVTGPGCDGGGRLPRGCLMCSVRGRRGWLVGGSAGDTTEVARVTYYETVDMKCSR